MTTQLAKEASRLFSTAVFRPVLDGGEPGRADALVERLRTFEPATRGASNHAVVHVAYAALCRDYRSEYFYKNLIASKIFVGRHRAANSVLLNEFRISDSVADCLLVNGIGTVYEIKTEFDSPDKLRRQLENYYRAFAYVNVVVHASDVDRYRNLLYETPTGLIAVGPRQQLSVVKVAVPSFDSFDLKTMFDVLRLPEIRSLLKRQFRYIPDVPNGLTYTTFLDLAGQISLRTFQQEMQAALKQRQLRHSREFILNESTVPLRSLVVQLDPDIEQQCNLENWLASKEH